MENEKTDEKLKNIEKEIDSAIDKLFVDKIDSQEKADEILSEQPESTHEKDLSLPADVPEEPIVLNEKILEDEDIETETPEPEKQESEPEPVPVPQDDYGQTIEKMKAKITAFSEWGITEKAVEKILSDIEDLAGKVRENKLALAVTGMLTDVLSFFKKNPGTPDSDLITFLSSGFSSLKSLLVPVSDETKDPEDTFSTINAYFSEISSKLTLDIPKIEMDPSIMSGNEFNEDIVEPSENEVQTEPGENTPEIKGDEPLDSLEEKEEDTLSLDMSFVAPDLPAEPETEREPFQEEEGIEAMTSIPSAEPEKDKTVPASYYKERLKEVVQAVKSMQKESFLIQGVIEITEKLSVEIESLTTLTNRFMAVISTGIPPQKDLKQLQDAVSALSVDFEIFSQIVGKQDDGAYKAEEITPVVVGRQMIGILSESIDHLYSITPQQEKTFRETGSVGLNDEKIPFVDLIKEFNEASENKNRRLLITDTPKGKKALLVDKVLKKRFAFANTSSPASTEEFIQIARFFLTEEIMIYKVK